MNRARSFMTLCILGLAVLLVTVAAARPRRTVALGPHVTAPLRSQTVAQRRIQVALLLDTSSSMEGLIDQAKSQLWRIVNELAEARKDGRGARVEIALYEYGKSTVPAADGYVRRILPFTADLDRVSEELFALRTNGGDEYCGLVIQDAVTGLEWSADPDDLKLVFIAGNESFEQGPVAPRIAIGAALEKGITVNVIHCGSDDDPTWRAGAALAHGDYMSIDHNSRVAAVSAPQDAEIERLGQELNQTYLAYGRGGAAALARQEAQDANAVSAAQGAATQRSLSKASVAYRNSSWDMVDAVADGTLDLAKDEALPPEMRAMTLEQRKAHVAAAAGKRKELQDQIRTLSAERDRFVAGEMRKAGTAGAATLDAAVLRSVHAQAEKAGYELKK